MSLSQGVNEWSLIVFRFYSHTTAMDVIKAHVFVTVVLTQLTALYADDHIPYFPIEVSRTAAGPYASMVFRAGILSCVLVMFFFKALRLDTFALWVSLCIIALFDDVHFWLEHMLGVVLMMLVAAFAAYKSGTNALAPLLAAMCVYAGRIVLKVLVILLFEKLPTWSNWVDFPGIILARHQDIMYRGARACTNPDAVMPVVKFCGVLQWAVFYAVSFIFQ
jgi:hypothetical protein